MSGRQLQRVSYQEGQILRAADLQQEQQSRLETGRRHHIAYHVWGIVHGLQLKLENVYLDEAKNSVEKQVVVEPGTAVDGFGRELILPKAFPIPRVCLLEVGSNQVGVWLMYMRLPAASQAHHNGGAKGQHRWREEAWIRLAPAGDDAHALDLVPSAAREFAPYQAPPDDPDRSWPVYLGRVPIPADEPANPVLEGRLYAALVGEMVAAPSGRARMQVGAESSADRRRFSVGVRKEAVADQENGNGNGAGAKPDSEILSDAVAIDQEGNLTVFGEATISEGDLAIEELVGKETTFRRPGSCEDERAGEDLSPRVEFEPLKSPPAAAAAWQIYRADVKEEGSPPVRQLRFEIAHPGPNGDPAQSLFAIGAGDVNAPFSPCLTVIADCATHIHGDLKVKGQVKQGPVRLDTADPRLQIALLLMWLAGAASTAGALPGVLNRRARQRPHAP